MSFLKLPAGPPSNGRVALTVARDELFVQLMDRVTPALQAKLSRLMRQGSLVSTVKRALFRCVWRTP